MVRCLRVGALMHVTNHAHIRWRQRFEKRIKGGIYAEFRKSTKWKANKVRNLGVRIRRDRRYYVTELCIFVIVPRNRTLVTILPRNWE